LNGAGKRSAPGIKRAFASAASSLVAAARGGRRKKPRKGRDEGGGDLEMVGLKKAKRKHKNMKRDGEGESSGGSDSGDSSSSSSSSSSDSGGRSSGGEDNDDDDEDEGNFAGLAEDEREALEDAQRLLVRFRDAKLLEVISLAPMHRALVLFLLLLSRCSFRACFCYTLLYCAIN